MDIPAYSEMPRVVLVTRKTRYKELLVKHLTASNAKFYLDSLGADFDDYVAEDSRYELSLQRATQALQSWGRYQIIERLYLPNYVFAEDDIVVVLGQNGTVANTLKYLQGQPVIGVNPDRTRLDGLLLPYEPDDLQSILPEVYHGKRPVRQITMAQASLPDGQRMLAVNDFFIGARTHTSALYEIEHLGNQERQSSSGIIVSTGLGSTAWLSSVIAGSAGVMNSVLGNHSADAEAINVDNTNVHMPWDTEQLIFAVREPFLSKGSSADIVYGKVTAEHSLSVRSQMASNGVIFSDGIESDFIRFDAGLEVEIGIAEQHGCLVH